jgi:hypothetical protein
VAQVVKSLRRSSQSLHSPSSARGLAHVELIFAQPSAWGSTTTASNSGTVLAAFHCGVLGHRRRGRRSHRRFDPDVHGHLIDPIDGMPRASSETGWATGNAEESVTRPAVSGAAERLKPASPSGVLVQNSDEPKGGPLSHALGGERFAYTLELTRPISFGQFPGTPAGRTFARPHCRKR